MKKMYEILKRLLVVIMAFGMFSLYACNETPKSNPEIEQEQGTGDNSSEGGSNEPEAPALPESPEEPELPIEPNEPKESESEEDLEDEDNDDETGENGSDNENEEGPEEDEGESNDSNESEEDNNGEPEENDDEDENEEGSEEDENLEGDNSEEDEGSENEDDNDEQEDGEPETLKFSLYKLAETSFNSKVYIKDVDEAAMALKLRLSEIEINEKLIDISEITNIYILKVYNKTIVANIELLDKNILVKISFNEELTEYSSLEELIEKVAIIDIEIAKNAETFDFINYWNILNTKVRDRAINNDSEGIKVKCENIIFMSDSKLDNDKVSVDIIYDMIRDFQNECRVYQTTLEWDASDDINVLQKLYDLIPNSVEELPASDVFSIYKILIKSSNMQAYKTNEAGCFENMFTITLQEYLDIIVELYNLQLNNN